jgi:hypothetical protein
LKNISIDDQLFSFCRTDKWAENDAGAKWGDKWEERFNQGSGNRQGETWNISPSGESEL